MQLISLKSLQIDTLKKRAVASLYKCPDTEERHSTFPLFLAPFPFSQHGYVRQCFLFPFPSFRILPLNVQKTLYFFHPSLCADLAVHYMTQTLLPFTFLNSTFSFLPLSMLFFLLKVFSNVKRLYFLKKNFPFLSAVSFSTSCCSVTLEAQTNLQYSQVLQAEFSLDRMVRFDA